MLGGWLELGPAAGDPAALTIQGKELEAQYPGMGRVRVTPDIAISLGEETRGDRAGGHPWSRILVKSLPDSAVAVSDVSPSSTTSAAGPQGGTAAHGIKAHVGSGTTSRLKAMGLQDQGGRAPQHSSGSSSPLSGNGQLELRGRAL